MARNVYAFGAGEADGHGEQENLLGVKGAGLAEMAALGVPVPPGFTLTTDISTYYATHQCFPEGLDEQVAVALERVGDLTDSRFGDADNPLLVSVRPGAPQPIAGEMLAVLNLGLNDDTVKGLAATIGDSRFAYDCYRRFVAQYGEVVMGVRGDDDATDPFAAIFAAKQRELGVESETELTADDLKTVVTEYKIEILRAVETPFPEDPKVQLWGAIGAAFREWNSAEAVAHRQGRGIAAGMGTAVTVQTMVFGNLGNDCGTGVMYSRDPATGEPGGQGKFLCNAQGRDVIAGARAPVAIDDLSEQMVETHAELVAMCDRLEKHFSDMLEIQFTIQRGKLWLLQVRGGERSGQAMVKIAVDMVADGLIDARTAVQRIDPLRLEEILHHQIGGDCALPVLARGLAAAPGAATGKVVFSSAEAIAAGKDGDASILVLGSGERADHAALVAAAGLVIVHGAMTSRAAVAVRNLGKPCLSGCYGIDIDVDRGHFAAGDVLVRRGDVITIDGSGGRLFKGAAALVEGAVVGEFATLMDWADEFRRLKVRANVNTAADAAIARDNGAEGIGLCRTEHMFFAPDRIDAMRAMIIAGDEAERRAALAKLLPAQRADFAAIFTVMEGRPVTVRLLDRPLAEFLPTSERELAKVASTLGVRPGKLAARLAELYELNPMLGLRGCRLALRYPEIYQTQVRAIAEAAAALIADGIDVRPEIMIPLVTISSELGIIRALVASVFDEVMAATGVTIAYRVGAMIELPRACMVGDRIAEHADFFSFGTNDLTQTAFGFSRDDSSRFLGDYLSDEIISGDPFVTLDREGVGGLIRVAVEKGRAKKTKLKIGICGEQGGEPRSIEFCHSEGFDYVSCSPHRVVIARVAAARAALRREARTK